MKILVTGSNGFIGRNLVSALLKKDHEVLSFTRESVFHPIENLDIIINCAATIHSPHSHNYFLDNVKLPYSLIKYYEPKKFIQIGSSSEYGPVDHVRCERDGLEPSTMYEGTKAAASMLVLGMCRDLGIEVGVARPFSIYGPSMKETSFFKLAIKAVQEEASINIYPGGHDWIYIDDFVNGICLMVERSISGVYNFSTRTSIDNAELVIMMETVIGKNCKPIIHTERYRPYDVDFWYGLTTKTANELDWFPETILQEGIRKCL